MIDFDKFGKYSKAGPRYTSYPTAIEFSEDFKYDAYIKRLETTQGKLSLYFHLPFCRSACYFCGCNVVFTSKEEKRLRYIEYLFAEMELLKNHLDTSLEVIQLHFGGGTPTFFSDTELAQIITKIKEVFPNFAKEAEISCEIDPRFLTREQMKVLTDNGFNRVSFGIQDFDEKVQTAVHRVQSFELSQSVMRMAREFKISSINIDLIYGLPYQSLESFKKTLELSLELDPDRLAIFNYAHVPWLKKTMRKIDETTLPKPKEKLEILKHMIDFLTHHGYKIVGMDHFAKPEDELFQAIEEGHLHRNFQGYTTKGGATLIGIGLTSIGEGEDFYAQNYKDMRQYEEAIDAGRLPFWRGVILNQDDIIRKEVIMDLMANFWLDTTRIEKQFGIDFEEYFKTDIPKLQPFIDDGLLTYENKIIHINETGSMLIRNIAMSFDAYLAGKENKKIFSKTV